ncbi:hypothetical protein NI26_13345 [Curtobacterium sp. MR_MD2014]|nr:hypothetical protein NI26_13345 [Curtobacterium sp. MR_MD2014]
MLDLWAIAAALSVFDVRSAVRLAATQSLLPWIAPRPLLLARMLEWTRGMLQRRPWGHRALGHQEERHLFDWTASG